MNLRPLIALLLLTAFWIPTCLSAADMPMPSKARDEAHLKADLERLSKNPKDFTLMREAAISYNLVGAPENWDYLLKAQTLLEQCRKLQPNDPFTLIFLGSTMAMRARSSDLNPLSRASIGNEGLSLMDRAVELDPKNYRLRLMRGTSCLAAPSFLMRGELLEQDVQVVKATLEPSPSEQYPPYLWAAGYLLLGTYHERKEELNAAQRYWHKAIKHGAGTRYESEAQKKLASHRLP